MEAFRLRGHWWLPGDDPENAMVGVLTFDPQGHTELSLFGSFSLKPRDMPIILGKSDNGRVITLVKCVVEITDHLGGGYNWEYSKYRFEVILQNHHFERNEDIVFELFRIKYAGLDNWASMDKSGERISVEESFRSQPGLHSVTHPVNVGLDDFKLSIRRIFTREVKEWNEYFVQQDTEIDVVPVSNWGIDEFFFRILQLKVFLSLAMGTSTWPVSVRAYNSAATQKTITVHYNTRTRFVNKYLMKEGYMYFTLEKQRMNLEKCLRNWFANYNKLEQVLNLYNRCISSALIYDDEFLYFTKAVEVFHRKMHHMHDETYIDKADYQALRKKFVLSIPEYLADTPKEKIDLLTQRINSSLRNANRLYANRPSFRGRLEDIRDRYQNNGAVLFNNFDELVSTVVKTRNYLTHYDATGKSKIRSDVYALNYMSMRLRYILEICLLSELGFDETDLQDMVSNNIQNRLSTRRPDRPFPKPKT